MKVQRFEYDRWVDCGVWDLKPGDLFIHDRQAAVLTDAPYRNDQGEVILTAEPYQEEPIQLYLDGPPYTGMAMDYTNSSLRTFEDGTALLMTDFESGQPQVYSPRLPTDELEAFLERHIDRYEAFFDQQEARLDAGEVVPMAPFWSSEEAKEVLQ